MTTRAATFGMGLMLVGLPGLVVAGDLLFPKNQSLGFACGFIAGQAASLKELGATISPESDECHVIRLRAIKDGLTAAVVQNVYGKPL